MGLPMSKFSVAVKYINTNHPGHRDELVVNNLKIGKDGVFFKEEDWASEDEDTDSKRKKRVFHYSKHEYYECRPIGTDYVMKTGKEVGVDFDNMCPADWRLC